MSNSNIHGINHNQGYNNNNQYDPNDTEPIFSKFAYRGDPKQQSIPSFLKESICPFFSFKSFTFIIIVINIVIYIITLIPHGLDDGDLYLYFLPPSSVTLRDFGDLYGYKIRERPEQFYRWITHNFLHSGFEHISSNCLCTLIFCSMFEYLIGTWKLIILYFASGILGGLFSVLIKPETGSVGASICCYGIIGAYLGFDFINWNRLERIYGTKSKCMILMFPIIMVIFTMPIFVSTTEGSGIMEGGRINIIGHIGGLIFGFFLSLFVLKPQDNTDSCGFNYKIYFFSGIAAVASFTLIGFLCFYLLDKYVGYSS